MEEPGAFQHDDVRDRPADVYVGAVTLHSGGDADAFLLLPITRRADAAEPERPDGGLHDA